jgi:hypothetical protein
MHAAEPTPSPQPFGRDPHEIRARSAAGERPTLRPTADGLEAAARAGMSADLTLALSGHATIADLDASALRRRSG